MKHINGGFDNVEFQGVQTWQLFTTKMIFFILPYVVFYINAHKTLTKNIYKCGVVTLIENSAKNLGA